MSKLLSLLLVAGFAVTAQAKLPAPTLDDSAKAKAEETKARQAWQAKADSFKLCQVQDRIAAKFGGKEAKPTPVVAKAAASAPAAAASGTPVAAAPPTPCTNPGPFAYNPPEQKPLETSGAHSPTATSGSPPSVRPESAKMAPAKPSTGPAAGASAAAGKKS
jgi:hypothetical protein